MTGVFRNLKELFSKGIANDPVIVKVQFMVIAGAVGGVILLAYSLINFAISDYPIAVVELLLAALLFLAMAVAINTKTDKTATTIGIIPILIISLHNFVSGGFFSTGLLWCYVLPPVMIFLVGWRFGLILHVLFILVTFLVRLLQDAGLIAFLYSDFEYLMFIITLSIVFLMTFLFESAWERSSKIVLSKGIELHEKNRLLEESVAQLKQTQESLTSSVERYESSNQELQKLNTVLLNRATKMVELKKRLQKYEPVNDTEVS